MSVRIDASAFASLCVLAMFLIMWGVFFGVLCCIGDCLMPTSMTHVPGLVRFG